MDSRTPRLLETQVHRDAGPDGVAAVGYDVRLDAQCVGPGPWDPGGERAIEMREHLEQLAEAVIPAQCHEDVQLAPFEPTLQLRPQADWQPEVRLTIEIRHDHDYFASIDDEERACVRRLERALERWGAHAEAWPATPKTRG